ncbi:MAG: DUF4186 family protein [Candidatus Nanohaloarchaea archaeon]
MRKLKLPGRDKTRPRLTEHDIRLIEEQGIHEIKDQAQKIVNKKLREQPDNDGQQTPSAGNPVYKAMHACNVASRKELSRSHKIPAGKELTDRQVEAVVNLLTRWIVREYNFYKEEKREQQKNLGEFSNKEENREKA